MADGGKLALSASERLVAQQMAREDLYFYSRYMFLARRGYNWVRNYHHQIICEELEAVFRGETQYLVINIPPRYGKTELAVINFVSWCLGKCPDAEFILPSYAASLAVKNSFECRELVKHEEYQAIFPDTIVSPDSSAKGDWKTTAGGAVFAPGVDGTTTGMGAGKMRESFGGAIIIDDPHKANEGRSDIMRANVINWIQETVQSRRNHRNTPIILIMQRLHEEDLSGWVIAGKMGVKWKHINLPAIQQDDEGNDFALWPYKHDLEALYQLRTASPYMFGGQYAQSPSAADGNVFKPGKIKPIGAMPSGSKWVRGWDLASSVPEPGRMDPDYTVGYGLAETPDGRFVIFDIERLQGSADEVEATIVGTTHRDTRRVHQSLPQDPGQAGKSQMLYYAKKLKGFKFSASPESGDKITRAEPFAAQVNIGNVDYLEGCPYITEMINEMKMFPNGTHDDIVDAASRAFAKLTESPAKMRISDSLLTRLKHS